ncbi:hypothetical protein MLD38_001052 [Melastoma candidum]|uniref:Uncharacterized protein n=1 Tax=Melastoma candidum TaxID=119954 RepID=A0ACB9SDK6_9MYRT|nr:hypothetical protein MLD38_001052 [Melastoma candidum]
MMSSLEVSDHPPTTSKTLPPPASLKAATGEGGANGVVLEAGSVISRRPPPALHLLPAVSWRRFLSRSFSLELPRRLASRR